MKKIYEKFPAVTGKVSAVAFVKAFFRDLYDSVNSNKPANKTADILVITLNNNKVNNFYRYNYNGFNETEIYS